MAIENRNLASGTRLVAKYKGAARFCTIQEDGTYKLDGDQGLGKVYKSLSAAGSAIMGGIACNGWKFWSLAEGDEAKPETEETSPQTNGGGSRFGRRAGESDRLADPKVRQRKYRLIRRTPNQQGVAEGMLRIFCDACMKGYVVESPDGSLPEACPEGHRAVESGVPAGTEA
jgi:hypothetical protein